MQRHVNRSDPCSLQEVMEEPTLTATVEDREVDLSLTSQDVADTPRTRQLSAGGSLPELLTDSGDKATSVCISDSQSRAEDTRSKELAVEADSASAVVHSPSLTNRDQFSKSRVGQGSYAGHGGAGGQRNNDSRQYRSHGPSSQIGQPPIIQHIPRAGTPAVGVHTQQGRVLLSGLPQANQPLLLGPGRWQYRSHGPSSQIGQPPIIQHIPRAGTPAVGVHTQQGRVLLSGLPQANQPLLLGPGLTGPNARAPTIFPQSYGLAPQPVTQQLITQNPPAAGLSGHPFFVPQQTPFATQQPINLGIPTPTQMGSTSAPQQITPGLHTMMATTVNTAGTTNHVPPGPPSVTTVQFRPRGPSQAKRSKPIIIIDPSTNQEVTVNESKSDNPPPDSTGAHVHLHIPATVAPMSVPGGANTAANGAPNSIKQDFKRMVYERTTTGDSIQATSSTQQKPPPPHGVGVHIHPTIASINDPPTVSMTNEDFKQRDHSIRAVTEAKNIEATAPSMAPKQPLLKLDAMNPATSPSNNIAFVPVSRFYYSREFLLSIKDACVNYPPVIEKLNCFKRCANKDHCVPPDWAYYMEQSGDYRGTRLRGRECSIKGKQCFRNDPNSHHQPTSKELVGHKAENPWVRPSQTGGDLTEEDAEREELFRKFQGILNKLTKQKFQNLAEQALKLKIDSEQRLKGCIDKIFTNVLDGPKFSIAYANLCKVMSTIKVELPSEEGRKQKFLTFRRVLLTKCQQEFEKVKKDDEDREKMLNAIKETDDADKKKRLKEELLVLETKNHKRSLCNIRFIGELFKLKMLSETIMHECIVRLLRSSLDEESLECFATIMTTTGKLLDKPEAKIIKKRKISPRVKFLLQDVLDLRSNMWIPRRCQCPADLSKNKDQWDTDKQGKRKKNLNAQQLLDLLMQEENGKDSGMGRDRDRVRDRVEVRGRQKDKSDARKLPVFSKQREKTKFSRPPKVDPLTLMEGWREREVDRSGSTKKEKFPTTSYMSELTRQLGDHTLTNDEIFDWIEIHCAQSILTTPGFVTNLTAAVANGSLSEHGQLSVDNFANRTLVLKKYVEENKELQFRVLYSLQTTAARLKHPPGLLITMFDLLYDLEIVRDDVFQKWREEGMQAYTAVQSVKAFLDCLDSSIMEVDSN